MASSAPTPRHASDRPPPIGPLRRRGALALLVAVIAALDWWMWRPLMRDAASVNWPTAPAVVTASGITPRPFGQEPALRFARTVDGHRHGGGHESFASACGKSADASAIAARYPVGQPIDIRYAPQQPELAVVRLGIYTRTDRASRAAIALLVIVMLMMAGSRYGRRDPD